MNLRKNLKLSLFLVNYPGVRAWDDGIAEMIQVVLKIVISR